LPNVAFLQIEVSNIENSADFRNRYPRMLDFFFPQVEMYHFCNFLCARKFNLQ